MQFPSALFRTHNVSTDNTTRIIVRQEAILIALISFSLRGLKRSMILFGANLSGIHYGWLSSHRILLPSCRTYITKELEHKTHLRGVKWFWRFCSIVKKIKVALNCQSISEKKTNWQIYLSWHAEINSVLKNCGYQIRFFKVQLKLRGVSSMV